MDASRRPDHSTQKSITIVALEWHDYERRRSLMRSQPSAGKQGWKSKIVFADRRYTDAPVTGLQIAEIIESSNSDQIAIVDEEFDSDPRFFDWLADFDDPSILHCAYQRMRAAKQGTNFFLLVYSFLVRILLRVGKHKFRPGAVVFYRNQNSTDWIDPTRDFSLTEFGAMARVAGHEVRETLVSPRSQPRTPIRSRAVVAQIGNSVRFWWNEIMFPGSRLISSDGNRKTEHRFKDWSRWRQAFAWMLLVFTTITVLSLNLGFPLFEPDEARNAQLALNILQTGEWNTLTLDGQPYWDKPPLTAWAIASSFQNYGISEFSARLPGNLAAMLTVLMVCALGRRLIGFRASLWGAMLMLTSVGFVFSGRFITTDSILALWSTIALLAGYLAIFRNNFSMKWWLVASAACGAGILTKGPIILILFLPPLVLVSWLAGNRELLKPRNWFWFALPMALIAGPWFMATAWVHHDFLYHFLWKHHVLRYADSFNHKQPFWYYLPAIIIGMFPASCLIPSMVRLAAKRDRITRSMRSPEVGFLIICACWVIGFFSMSQSKLPTYILPAYPFACLLLGWMLESTIFAKSSEQFSLSWLRYAPQRIGVPLVGATIAIQIVLLVFFKQNQAFLVYSIIVPSLLIAVAIMSFRRVSPMKTAWLGLAIVAIAFTIYAVDRVAPAFSASRSTHRAVLTLQNSLEGKPGYNDAQVIFFGREDYGATFQLDKQNLVSFKATEINEMSEFLLRHPHAIVVSSDSAIKNLRVALDWSIEIELQTGYRHLYLSRLGSVMSARRLQQEKLDKKLKR